MNGEERVKPFYQHLYYLRNFPLLTSIHEQFTFEAHWHPEVELAYVLEGKLPVTINGKLVELRAGQLAVCTSGDLHEYHNAEPGTKWLLLLFRPTFIGKADEWPPEGVELRRFVLALTEQEQTVLDAILQSMLFIYDEYQAKSPYFRSVIQGETMKLTSLLLRHFTEGSIGTNVTSAPKRHLPELDAFFQYVNDHFTEPLRLTDVAAQFALSPSRLSEGFSNTTGVSFVSYVQHKRVERAKDLLRTSRTPIMAVALECGFENLRTFNRVFRIFTGCTPTAYRNENG
jgi:AraC-like DNA-binding protein